MSGLLGSIGSGLTSIWNGVNDFGNPQSVPDGAGYGPSDLALSRQALLAQIGTNLLAASQAGLRPEQRGQFLAQAGEAPTAAARVLAAGAQNRSAATSQALQAAQREETLAQAAQRRASAASDENWMQMLRGGPSQGTPIGNAAMPAAGRTPAAGNFVQAVFDVESGGRPDARPLFRDGTPRSSALGPAQFIDSTWLSFASANPQFFEGMSRDQILAQRTNPELNARATQWYGDLNGAALSRAGIPDTPQNRFLAHSFGSGGAMALLRADPSTPAVQVLGEGVIRANPELAGRTAGEAMGMRIGGFERRFGGAGQAPAAAPQQSGLVLGGVTIPEPIRQFAASLGPDASRQFVQQYVMSQQRQGQYRVLTPEQAVAAGMPREFAQNFPPNTGFQQNSTTGRFEPIVPPTPQIRDGEGGAQLVVPRPGGRADLEPIGPQRPSMPVDSRVVEAEGRLRGEVRQNPAIRDFQAIQSAFGNMVDNAQRNSGAGDVALIFNFMKMLDPTSVVREGEFALAQRTGGIPETVWALYQSARGGQRLTEGQRAQLLEAASGQFQTARTAFEREVGAFRSVAEQYGLSPDRVVRGMDDDTRQRIEGTERRITTIRTTPEQIRAMSEEQIRQLDVGMLSPVQREARDARITQLQRGGTPTPAAPNPAAPTPAPPTPPQERPRGNPRGVGQPVAPQGEPPLDRRIPSMTVEQLQQLDPRTLTAAQAQALLTRMRALGVQLPGNEATR